MSETAQLGRDVLLGGDLKDFASDAGGGAMLASEVETLAQDLALRFTTWLGSCFYDPSLGVRWQNYMGAEIEPGLAGELALELEDQTNLDPRTDPAYTEAAAEIVDRTIEARVSFGFKRGEDLFTGSLLVIADGTRFAAVVERTRLEAAGAVEEDARRG